MAPTKEEEHKLKEFKETSAFKLGPAEKFLKAVLDLPFAFQRVNAMLYIANFDSEVEYLTRSFETIEVNMSSFYLDITILSPNIISLLFRTQKLRTLRAHRSYAFFLK